MQMIHLFQANFRKQVIELKRYAPNMIAQFVTIYIIQFLGSPETQWMTIQYTIISYIFWYLSLNIANQMGYEIYAETSRGTFEQLGMSPSGLWKILSMRLISTILLNLIAITLLLYLSMQTTGETLNIDLISVLPIFIVTCISMFGLSFMIAGLSIILKQIQAFLQIFQFVLAGLSFISTNSVLIHLFLPFVKGLDMIRAIMIGDFHITDFRLIDFIVLLGNGILYFGIGLAFYLLCERYARSKGLLGQY